MSNGQLNKPPKSMKMRIKSSKMLPCFKRFFLFMTDQGVQFSKDDVKRWNREIMAQKSKDHRNTTSTTTCSFVAISTKTLPKLQGLPENALSSLSGALKKYGEILWFKVVKEKAFINFNVFTVKQAAILIKDIESRKLEKELFLALGLDLFRAHPRFKKTVALNAIFCQSDIEAIRKVLREENHDFDAKADMDRSVGENFVHGG